MPRFPEKFEQIQCQGLAECAFDQAWFIRRVTSGLNAVWRGIGEEGDIREGRGRCHAHAENRSLKANGMTL